MTVTRLELAVLLTPQHPPRQGDPGVPPASLFCQSEVAPQKIWLADFMLAQGYFIPTSQEYLAIYLAIFVNPF